MLTLIHVSSVALLACALVALARSRPAPNASFLAQRRRFHRIARLVYAALALPVALALSAAELSARRSPPPYAIVALVLLWGLALTLVVVAIVRYRRSNDDEAFLDETHGPDEDDTDDDREPKRWLH